MTEPLPIPEVQRRLRALAGEARQLTFRIENLAREIETLADAASRRARVRPTAPAKSNPITPELEAEIVPFTRAHPEMSNEEIGRMFGVAGGRVSECLQRAADREHVSPPRTFSGLLL